jgi:hypothetical protein
LSVKPPHIVGPHANLELRKGELNGMLNGRPIHLRIDNEGAQGEGPFGNVAIDLADGPDLLEVSGVWSGSRVTFTVTPESMRGTIPVYRFVRAEHNGGPEMCLDCDRPSGGARSGSALPSSVETCQYVLDQVGPDGSRAGVSICSGLPERTRLEIPPAIQSWLTRSELVVVILALLAVAPTDVSPRL